MSNIDFLEKLRENAYKDVDETGKTLDLQGWMSPNFTDVFTRILTDTFDKFARPLVIVEIGTWKGLTACTMANIAKQNNIPCTIICIDTWLGSPEYWTSGLNEVNKGLALNIKNGYPQLYYTFLNNILIQEHQNIIIPLPMSSNEASEILNYYGIKADILYIDGAQEYTSVHNDLSRYWKILHNSGYVFGSNYCDDCDGVKMATNDFSRAVLTDKLIDGILWIIQKPINYL